VELSLGDGEGGEQTPRPGAGPGRVSGRYEAGVPEAHRGARITSLSWSPAGDAFVCGDDGGVCSVVVLGGKLAGAHTIRFKQPIAQVSFLEDGTAALVSTAAQLYLLYRRDGYSKTCVGSTPRDGPFGAAAHPIAHMGVPEGLELDMMGAGAAAGHEWFFGARPGRRLWLCRVPHACAACHDGEVVATLRPSLPAASAPPGGMLPAKLPKKWEFGRVLPIGPCLLSVSDKVLSVVDFVGGAVLAWYPMDVGSNSNSTPGGLSHSHGQGRAHALGMGLAVEGSRAFVLGGDGGVWCLQAPHTAAALVRSTAMLAAAAGAGPEMTADEQALLADPRYHARRLAARFGIQPPHVPSPADLGRTTCATSSSDSEGGGGGEGGVGVGGSERASWQARGVLDNAGDDDGYGNGHDMAAEGEGARQPKSAVAAAGFAGDGRAAAAVFDNGDSLLLRRYSDGGSLAAEGSGGVVEESPRLAASSSFPAAKALVWSDFPAAITSASANPASIITRTRNPRGKRRVNKRVAGIEDLPPAARAPLPSVAGSISHSSDRGALHSGVSDRTNSGCNGGAAAPTGSIAGDLVNYHRAKIICSVAEGGGAATSATAATSPSSGSDSGIPLPPVVIDGDGNLLLDTPQMQTSADNAGCSRTRPFEVPGSPGSDEAGDVAEEGASAVSPSIEMWLGRKEEARAGRAVATAAAAATRESVALPRGPRTPLEDAFCTAGSARIEEAQEYDAVVRETASLAIELDRVAEAEAREAAEDEEDRLAEEAAAPRGPTGMKGGVGPRRHTHSNRSGNRGAVNPEPLALNPKP
jgi:hypothetical protein